VAAKAKFPELEEPFKLHSTTEPVCNIGFESMLLGVEVSQAHVWSYLQFGVDVVNIIEVI
jgi:hypothetical protein